MPYFASIMATINPSVNAQAEATAVIHPRFMVEVSPELMKLLQRLMDRSGSTKIDDVLQKAIALLDIAAQVTDKGQKIAILDKDNKLVKEIVGI